MVRCADCGFLCVRDDNEELIEVDIDYRQNPGAVGPFAGKMPICFVRACDLRAEVNLSDKTTRDFRRSTGIVLSRERDCDKREKFTPWQQGWSPKEHAVMLTEQQEREWRSKQEKELRDWQDARHKEDQDREEARQRREQEYRSKRDREEAEWKAKQERHSGRQLWIAGVAAAIAAALILALAQVLCTWWQIYDVRAARTARPAQPASTMPAGP